MQLDEAPLFFRDAAPGEHGEVGLRILEHGAGVASHAVVGPHQEGLSRLSETVGLPVSPARHDRVHGLDGQLHCEHPDHSAAREDRRGHEGVRLAARRQIALEVHEGHRVRAGRLARGAEGAGEVRLAVGPARQADAEIALALHAEDDATRPVVDQVEVGIAEALHEPPERLIQRAVGFLVGARVGRREAPVRVVSLGARLRGVGHDVEQLEDHAGGIRGHQRRLEENGFGDEIGQVRLHVRAVVGGDARAPGGELRRRHAVRLPLQVLPGGGELPHGLADEARFRQRARLEAEPGEVGLDGAPPLLAHDCEPVDRVRLEGRARAPIALDAGDGHGGHPDGQEGQDQLGSEREIAQRHQVRVPQRGRPRHALSGARRRRSSWPDVGPR